MAKASGRVGGPLSPPSAVPIPGAFFHSPSNASYRVVQDYGDWYFEFQKRTTAAPGGEIRGRRRIDYFIGSGAHGQGLLFSVKELLFQAPIAYYSDRGAWDMAPGYEGYRNIFLGRLVKAECLECHASGIRRVGVMEGHYDSPAFAEGAVSCERCHGPGKAHIAQMTVSGRAAPPRIVNPAKLDPRRRESICAQCHLFGEARVPRPGRSFATYRPGDLLSEHIVSFVWSSPSADLKAVGHFESLWRSRCKRVAGDRLWCGTCHDPHSVPRSAERTAFYREKCLECHAKFGCTTGLAARIKTGNDCVACHMPKVPVVDGHQTAFTNHSIPKLPSEPRPYTSASSQAELVSFWGGRTDIRDIALAYATVAEHSASKEHYSRAFSALQAAAKEAPADSDVMTQLGWIYERLGQSGEALRAYRIAVQSERADVATSVNLASLLAQRGDVSDAIRLWQNAMERDPGQEAPAINLSRVYLQKGDPIAARGWLLKALEFNPDSPSALELWPSILPKASR